MDIQRKPSPIEEVQTAPVLDAEECLPTHAVAEYGNLPAKTVKSVEQILNENYDQEEYLIYDIVGFRRMKCVVCGAIQPEKEFVKHNTCNKGTCRKCTSRK